MVFGCGCEPKPAGSLSRRAGPRGASGFPLDAVACLEQRLSAANRLKKSGEFTRVFKQPFRSVDRQFIVLAKQNNLPLARLGLAIAKKRIPLAVNRNRIKRLIRESFRHNKSNLIGLDIVVMVQSRFEQERGAVLTAALCRHWRRIAQCSG